MSSKVKTAITPTRAEDYPEWYQLLEVQSLQGEIYKQSMALADKLEITRVHASFKDADTFFPEIDKTIWKEVNRETNDADEKHAHAFSFITYMRK